MNALDFDKPGPGAWTADRTHQQVPAPLLFQSTLSDAMTAGLRRGFASVGALLDTIEARFVHGWLYTAPRPLGAPPDATSTPPKLVFKALLMLHPALRRRVAVARRAWAERPWLDYAARFEAVEVPRQEARLRAL